MQGKLKQHLSSAKQDRLDDGDEQQAHRLRAFSERRNNGFVVDEQGATGLALVQQVGSGIDAQS